MQEREVYRVGDLELDVDSAVIRRQTPLAVTGLSFDLFVLLVRRAPAIVSPEALLETLWSDVSVGEETLKQRIRLLRKGLGDDARQPTYVATVRGKGYKLIAPVQRLNTPPETPQQQTTKAPTTKLTRWIPAFLIALIAAVLFALMAHRNKPQQLTPTVSALELHERAEVYYRRYKAEDNQLAIALLQEAIDEDQNFAQAYALLSRAYSQQPKLGNGYFGEQALQAAQRAVQLSPDSPEGYLSMGLYYGILGRVDEALENYHHALEVDPDNAIALANVAHDLEILGRLDEALAFNAQSLKLDTSLYFSHVQMARTLARLDYDQQAEDWFKKGLKLQPDNPFIRKDYAQFLISRERTEEATTLLENASAAQFETLKCLAKWFANGTLPQACLANIEDPNATFYQALLDRQAGHKTTAFATFESKLSNSRDHVDPEYLLDLAMIATVDEQHDQALDLLQEAVARGWRDRFWLIEHPIFAELHSQPQWQQLIQQIEHHVLEARKRVEAQGLVEL